MMVNAEHCAANAPANNDGDDVVVTQSVENLYEYNFKQGGIKS